MMQWRWNLNVKAQQLPIKKLYYKNIHLISNGITENEAKLKIWALLRKIMVKAIPVFIIPKNNESAFPFEDYNVPPDSEVFELNCDFIEQFIATIGVAILPVIPMKIVKNVEPIRQPTPIRQQSQIHQPLWQPPQNGYQPQYTPPQLWQPPQQVYQPPHTSLTHSHAHQKQSKRTPSPLASYWTPISPFTHEVIIKQSTYVNAQYYTPLNTIASQYESNWNCYT